MYTIVTLTPPENEPVTAEELRNHLRLNDDSEDEQLAEFIKTARETFERLTNTAVLTTEIRQYFQTLTNPITLMRGPITSIEAVKYYDGSNVLQTSSTHSSDIVSNPGLVWWTSTPTTSTTSSPVGYVDYTIGYDEDTLPSEIKTAIKLFAGMYYENRESHNESDLKEVPLGFMSVVRHFKQHLQGSWGQ